MYATLNNIVDWIVGIWVVFLILFWLFPPFRNAIVWLGLFIDDRYGKQRSDEQQASAPISARRFRDRPPTDRQLNYIDDLIEQKEVDGWMLERHPETIDEASKFIDLIEDLPYRRHP